MSAPSTTETVRRSIAGHTNFYLVGIGGAGMSALAGMLSRRRYAVSGSDSTQTAVTRGLEETGIPVRIGHSGADLREGMAVVFSDAIKFETSPELQRAKEMGLPAFRRSAALGWLLSDRKLIAVTGTHGKTTTSGMLGAALEAAGMDPLVVVGAAVREWGSPVREGKGEWAVAEACEAYESYLDLLPQVVVLTNLELDHIDHHHTYEALRESVLRFVRLLPPDGMLLYCEQDPGATEVAHLAGVRAQPYRALEGIELKLPGYHNRLNAGGALAAALVAGAKENEAMQGIAEFEGAERRLQTLYDGDLTVVDDYAHHPTEVRASLQTLRQPGRRLVSVFQPHLYSRTAQYVAEFAAALDEADLVVLTDIYPAREAPVPGVSASLIEEKITKPVRYVPSRRHLVEQVMRLAQPGDVIVGMGAGNISEFAPAFVHRWTTRPETGRKTRVTVLFGGDSAEREVSLHSGPTVADALRTKGYDARLFDITEMLLGKGDIGELIGSERPDVAFLAVHGVNAEDGAIQGFLELIGLPYTGSRLQASAIAMNKQLTKEILSRAGFVVPRGVLLEQDDVGVLPFGVPLVVKPNAQGSTVGLTFVDTPEGVGPAVRRALAFGSGALVEEMLVGMEVSIPVLGDRALPAVEIAPVNGKYDFANKYTPSATDEIVPARLPDDVLRRLGEIALGCHRALGCESATRTDMIVTEDRGPVVLEVNTLPGLTRTSLLPRSAAAAGLPFPDLIDWIVQDALRRYAQAP